VVFFKLPTAIIGDQDAIVLPKNSREPDYEGRTPFIIGKGGYRIPAAAWREHVYGFTIINDVRPRCAAGHFAVVAREKLPHLLPDGPRHRHRR